MHLKYTAAVATLALAASFPATAGVITLNFEGINDFAFVEQYYNGGTDSPAGSADIPASGPNLGVYFGPVALALASGSSTFGNVMTPVGTDASLFAAAGSSFIGSLSFSYWSLQDFSLDILGSSNNVLGTLALSASPAGCSIDTCGWSSASRNFSGTASSFRFGSGYNADVGSFAAFDNITVTTAVPEPAMGWLLLSGVALIGGARLRRRAST